MCSELVPPFPLPLTEQRWITVDYFPFYLAPFSARRAHYTINGGKGDCYPNTTQYLGFVKGKHVFKHVFKLFSIKCPREWTAVWCIYTRHQALFCRIISQAAQLVLLGIFLFDTVSVGSYPLHKVRWECSGVFFRSIAALSFQPYSENFQCCITSIAVFWAIHLSMPTKTSVRKDRERI